MQPLQTTSMVPLGIVRKLDDLGRVVIPMEIRREAGWKSGQPLEMFATKDGGLYIKGYSLGEADDAIRTLEKQKDFVDNLKEKRVLDAAIKLLKK